MRKQQHILAIDQGTSSTKAIIFDENGRLLSKGLAALHTSYHSNGFVEQDAEGIYENMLEAVALCLNEHAVNGHDIACIATIGISNQRETFIVWDKNGKPLHPAIVWQCKRSVAVCNDLKEKGMAEMVSTSTGLLIDPYFSATKLMWLNQNNDDVANAIKNNNAFFGTVDSWLLYRMTNGAVHATDHSNASRTLLFNLKDLCWDEELIDAFGLKGIILPVIQTSASHFGSTTLNGLLPEAIPISSMVGDSHAAAFGEGCFRKGAAKATLGTGCSIMMNIGDHPVLSTKGMVSTICWSIPGRIDYALEGVIVSCGSTVEWLKNTLQLFKDSKETEAMARSVESNGGVYLVPAFSGLGSPHWQMHRRASLLGLTFGSTKEHITRAALESIAYQIKDVIAAMESDAGTALEKLMADGGIASNSFVLQFTADLLERKVETIHLQDVSALGAALLAGIGNGIYGNMAEVEALVFDKKIYTPDLSNQSVTLNYKDWQAAIEGK